MIKELKNSIIYLAFIALQGFIKILPRRIVLQIATFIGHFLFPFFKLQMTRNIMKTLGMPYERAKRLAIKNIAYAAKNFADMLWVEPNDLTRIKVKTKNLQTFDRLYERGNGVIVITGHIGCFEMIHRFLATRKDKMAVISRKIYDHRIDKLVLRNREWFGTRNLYSRSSPRQILKLLKSGYAIGFLVDLEIKPLVNTKITIFNREKKVPIGPIKIAMKLNQPLLPLAIYRTDDDNFYLKIFDPIAPDKDNIEQNLQKVGEAFEKMIATKPDEWVWFKDEWLT